MLMAQVNIEQAYDNYIKSLKSGNDEEIREAKYKILWESANFFELIVNYIALDKLGLRYDFGKDFMPKGTKLYRIRSYSPAVDFSNPYQWNPPPDKPQNRANMKEQAALYLGSTETVCLLETHIKKGDTYALGIYEVTDDIEVGGYLSSDPKNMLHEWAGMILNAFLIAPSRNDRNKELFSYLDAYYGKLTLDDFKDINELKGGALQLPMKFGVLNQLDQLYNLTNQLCNILARETPDGIRYSSCYLPLETVSIMCSDYNIVLYNQGISKVKFIDYEINTNIKEFNYTDLLKVILNRN